VLEESVVVLGDDVLLEAVGRQGGAAGVLGADLLDGELQLEIDAADPNELCTVRVWHDGAVSPAASAVLDTLFGARAELITQQLMSGRPVRLMGSESRRMTSFRGGVPYELQSFVGAADGLSRVGVPEEVRAMLDLVRHVSALQSRLPSTLNSGSDQFLLSLALSGASDESYRLLSGVLNDAVELGVLTRAAFEELQREGRREVLPVEQLHSLRDMVLPDLSVRLTTNLSSVDALVSIEPIGVAVQVHESSLFCNDVRWRWVGENNLEVRLTNPGATGPLWVRAWADGTTPVAAVPMNDERGLKQALLLVPPQAARLVIDVASSVDQRLFGSSTVALERAYDLGRRAARIERRAGELEADPLWRACAQAHDVAGDVQRSKMAIGRRGMRRAISPVTASDHLLL
jgi:hypothetical protein